MQINIFSQIYEALTNHCMETAELFLVEDLQGQTTCGTGDLLLDLPMYILKVTDGGGAM